MAANGANGAGLAGGVGEAGGEGGAVAAVDIPSEVKEEFRNLLRRKKSEIGVIIQRLASTFPVTTDFFTAISVNLPKASIRKQMVPGGAAAAAPVERTFFSPEDDPFGEEEIFYVTGGSFGKIYKGRSGFIYKEVAATDADISTPMKIEQHIKSILCEAFIQVLLSADEDFGLHVPRITGLFISPTAVRQSLRQKSASGRRNLPAHVKERFTFYIKMEQCQRGVIQYLSSAPADRVTTAKLAPVCTQLGNALSYFSDTYGFKHRDLHSGNVMVNVMGGAGGGGLIIKIIDFGQACITINGVTYARDPHPCVSYDLLIFMASIRQVLRTRLEADAMAVLQWFFTNSEGMDLYRYIEVWIGMMVARGSEPAYSDIFPYFYESYSLGEALRGWPNQPWTATSDPHPDQTLYQTFFESGAIPARNTFDMFLWKWSNPTAADPAGLAGGGHRRKKRLRIDGRTKTRKSYVQTRRRK